CSLCSSHSRTGLSHSRDHPFHFRDLRQILLRPLGHEVGLLNGGIFWQLQLYQELSFIDLRKEIRTDITQGQQGDGTDEKGHGDQQRLQFVVQGPLQDGSNFSSEPGKSGLELMDDLSEER